MYHIPSACTYTERVLSVSLSVCPCPNSLVVNLFVLQTTLLNCHTIDMCNFVDFFLKLLHCIVCLSMPKLSCSKLICSTNDITYLTHTLQQSTFKQIPTNFSTSLLAIIYKGVKKFVGISKVLC